MLQVCKKDITICAALASSWTIVIRHLYRQLRHQVEYPLRTWKHSTNLSIQPSAVDAQITAVSTAGQQKLSRKIFKRISMWNHYYCVISIHMLLFYELKVSHSDRLRRRYSNSIGYVVHSIFRSIFIFCTLCYQYFLC